MACDEGSDHGELGPRVTLQDGEHCRRLVLDRGRQLELWAGRALRGKHTLGYHEEGFVQANSDSSLFGKYPSYCIPSTIFLLFLFKKDKTD